MNRLTGRLDMTIAVVWDVKPQTKQNKNVLQIFAQLALTKDRFLL